MGEDEDFGHIVPLLRRIIILVAVITAIPVVLWTITAFVRTYVNPPKIPTFHQLAASVSADAPLDIKPPQTVSVPQTATAAMASPAEPPKPSGAMRSDAKPSQPMTAEARVTPRLSQPRPLQASSR
jgi:cytoskeletal protein RodZ